MNESRENRLRLLLPNAMRFGLYLGVVVSIAYLIVYQCRLDQGYSFASKTGASLLPMLVWIVGLFIGLKTYRDKSLGREIALAHAFLFCIYLCFFASLILSLVLLIYSYIDPFYLINLNEDLKQYLNMAYETYYKPLPNGANFKTMFDSAAANLPHSMKEYIMSIMMNNTMMVGVVLGLIESLILKRTLPSTPNESNQIS